MENLNQEQKLANEIKQLVATLNEKIVEAAKLGVKTMVIDTPGFGDTNHKVSVSVIKYL